MCIDYAWPALSNRLKHVTIFKCVRYIVKIYVQAYTLYTHWLIQILSLSTLRTYLVVITESNNHITTFLNTVETHHIDLSKNLFLSSLVVFL